jgi:hypothetical protein
MTCELLGVWKGKIENDNYVCHCQVLMLDVPYLKVSEYVKDPSGDSGRRFIRGEAFKVGTVKFECSIWLSSDGKRQLQAPFDIVYAVRKQIIEAAISDLESRGEEVF